MIGCTTISPSYQEVGLEAVKRFKRHTGLDVVILFTDDENSYDLKLEIPNKLSNQSVVFFDSDWWMIRDYNMAEFSGMKHFVAVKDYGVYDPMAFCKPDSETLSIDHELYFNSGFWIANFKEEIHRKAFAKARQMMQDKKNGVIKGIHDFGEQSILNAAIQKSGCPLKLIHLRWNYFHAVYRSGCISSIPWGIIGMHAAGIQRADKVRHLNEMCSIFQTTKDALASWTQST